MGKFYVILKKNQEKNQKALGCFAIPPLVHEFINFLAIFTFLCGLPTTVGLPANPPGRGAG
jgi:hypothetical protein